MIKRTLLIVLSYLLSAQIYAQSSAAIIKIIAEPDTAGTAEQKSPIIKTQTTAPDETLNRETPQTEDNRAQNRTVPNDVQQNRNQSLQMDIPAPLTGDTVILESGINAYNTGDYKRATEKFSEIQELFPTSPFVMQAKLYTARSLYKLNNRKEALENIEAIDRNSGEYPAALFLKGEIYLSMKQSGEAKNSFFQATSLFPGHDLADDSLLELSRIYLSENNGEEALKIAVQILSSYPDRDTSDDAFYMIGKIYEKDSRLKDIERARTVYQTFIKRAETEKRIPYYNSPLLRKVKRDLDYINKSYFTLQQ
ncbi:MAG: outer membrane protein assembly factor BamD [Spirochaetes bacterium]|jgi:outer membrane protein assembly factor BamD (BamD/ComL family)|nr:outer membrane protein assembly factor BamD [Spirochaetota bacterium]